MADEIRRSVIEIVAETSGASSGLRSLASDFLESNKAAIAAGAGVAALGAAFIAFKNTIDRGQAVSEVAAAFENLSQKAGVNASQNLERLASVTDNLVSKMDLMRASNEALLAGLSPEQFEKVAAAADQLGDAVGVDTKKALDDLTTAMATGVTRGLERTYGLVIDNKKALEDYAKSHGVAVNALTELGQREAARIAILEALQKQQEATGKANETVGDQFQKLGNIVEDVKDSFARWLNEQPQIVAFFKTLAEGAQDFARGLEVIFNTTTRAQLFNLQNRINVERERLTHRDGIEGALRDTFGSGGDFSKLKELERQYSDLAKTMNTVGTQQERNTDGIIDYGRAAAGAAKQADEAFKQWQKDLEELTGFSTRIIDNALNLQIGDSPLGTSSNIRIEPIEKGFENAVNFFADILTPTLEGEAANLEDIFDDMFKRVAIGFGSEMLATVTQQIFPGLLEQLGKLGGAQGLGKEIFGSIFGGGSLDLGFGLGEVGSLIPGIIAAVGAYFVGTNSISGAQQIFKGGDLSFAEQAALALPTSGLSFAYNPIKDFFGGDSEKSRQREAREAAIDQIFGGNASFQGVGGPITLSPGNFNVANNNPGTLQGQAVGLANPFGQIFGGGDPKLSEDLAGIFANAIGTAENFNEVLINTSSLMDSLGLDAEDAKNQLGALFLDGKVTLEQFIEGIRNLNVVAGDELVGPNGLAEAVNVLAESFESPRVQLKALELIFKDLAKQGIDTSDEIIAAMTSQFGPEIGEVFADLAAAGIDTWEEIKNASVDQLAIIFEALNQLPHEAAAAGDEAGDNLATGISDGAERGSNAIDRLERDFNRLERSANAAGRAAKSALNAQSSSGTSGSLNTSPNERRP